MLLLAAAVSLAMDTGRRRPAFYLLSASILALLVTDFVYGLMLLHGTYDHQLSLDIGWIGFYLLWGAAALHPSMRELDEPSPDAEAKLTPFRLALLAGASLIAPTMELIDAIRERDTDLIVVIGASVLLFSLVVARMAGLVRQQERSVAARAGPGQRRRRTGRGHRAARRSQRAALDSVDPLLERRRRRAAVSPRRAWADASPTAPPAPARRRCRRRRPPSCWSCAATTDARPAADRRAPARSSACPPITPGRSRSTCACAARSAGCC